MTNNKLAIIVIIAIAALAVFATLIAPPDSPLGKVIRSEPEPSVVQPVAARPTPVPSAKYPLTFDQEELMFFQINLKGNRVFILGTTNVQAILNPPTNEVAEVSSTNQPSSD